MTLVTSAVASVTLVTLVTSAVTLMIFVILEMLIDMLVNKNALLRYKTIDRCLRNRFRRWTLDDLVEACSEALYENEGITKGVSVRTIQADIQVMRSDRLGYNAPIEVYDNKYYRYAERDYAISDTSLDEEDIQLINKAVSMMEQYHNQNVGNGELKEVLLRLMEKLSKYS